MQCPCGYGEILHDMTDATGPSTRAVGLIILLVVAMGTSTFLQGTLSVLSRYLIDEFGITRSQLGIAFTVFALTGAIVSPAMGVFADRGARRAMIVLFALAASGLLVAAAAQAYGFLLVGPVLCGLALGAGNPATNRAISLRVPPSRRGLALGLKQAGSPLSLLAAGVVLPPIAVAFGWRAAVVAAALVPICGLLATAPLIPRENEFRVSTFQQVGGARSRSLVNWLTVIGAAVAMGDSAVIGFLPLYAQEELGFSTTNAGVLAGFMGFTGVMGRILWGTFASRFAHPSAAMMIISGISIASVISIAAAKTLGLPFVWLGALGMGASMLAWHSVAWLAIINRVGTSGVGKASGTMQLGNGLGFAAGAPVAGALVDSTGSYSSSWTLVGILYGLTLILTFWFRIRATRNKM